MNVRPVVVLEVGTYRTIALAGDVASDGTPRLLGLAQRESAGMRKGTVFERDQVSQGVEHVLSALRGEAGCDISQVLLLCSQGDVRDVPVSASVDVEGGEDGVVSPDDADAAAKALAEAAAVPDGRISMGLFPAGFTLDDGSMRILEPVERHARRLTAHGLLLHTDDHLLGDLVAAVQQGGTAAVSDEFFTGLAAATVSLTEEQKRDGALLIDFGAGSTSWCGYAGGVPVCGGSLAVGGDHVTNDIFLAFRTGSRLMAERLKVESATVDLASVGHDERVPVPVAFGAPDREVSRFALAQVAEIRMRETLEIVRERLRAQGSLDRFGAVVLSGGGARLRGLAGMVAEVFAAPVFAPSFASGDPRIDSEPFLYAAPWGCLRSALIRARQAVADRRRGIFERLLGGDGGRG